jgi:predicted nucleotidyltransferase
MDFCPRLGQNLCMGKDAVIQALQRHQRELNAAGIVHLRLFGSVARDEARDGSDIDLVADFDRTKRFTLLSMARLENRLSDLLGAKVDLAPADSLRDLVRARVQQEAIHAF